MALMHPSAATSAETQKSVVITDQDLIFHCNHCQGELVVDREGAGLQVNCPHCHRVIKIPPAVAPVDPLLPAPPPLPAEPLPVGPTFDFSQHSPEQMEQRHNELRGQLKENASQDVEMRGHINRATIELHRLQLKLKKLAERKLAIEAELKAVREAAPGLP